MFRKIIFCFLLFIGFYLLPPLAFAAEEFATNYDVTYDIDQNGVTTVTEKVTLRNLTSQYYATQFKITIGATQISDVKASDPSGPLSATTEQKDTSTAISVKFNQQVAGINKTLPWTLQFKSKDFATKVGRIWNLSVPKVMATQNMESYNLTVSVPLEFGEPTLMTPQPKSQTSGNGKIYFVFTKEQLESSGVSAEFGDSQLFNFNLTYNLENPSLIPLVTSIALPPDTDYQDVTFSRMEPKPLNVTIDADGNYLAWYRLNRGERISVKVIGSAKLYSKTKVKNPYLTDKQVSVYTRADKYWDKDNPNIKAKIAEILGPNPPDSNSEKAKIIHRYVVNLLKYDSSRLSSSGIERLGAATVLNNPSSAVCMEFTDLFIALTRAARIPARELDGFAYTSNSKLRPLSLSRDILHAWPEYFDPQKGWVMVDPTWENTTGGVDYFSKLDLNHFVFAIKGLSSEQPVPAGSYKYSGVDSHDVKVTLTEVDFLGKPLLDVSIENSNPLLSGLPDKIKVKITNLGNAVFTGAAASISTEKLTILDQTLTNVGIIPAFGFVDYEFNVRTKTFMDTFDDKFRVTIGGHIYSKDIYVRPFVLLQSFPFVIILVMLLFLVLYAAILGRFIYKRRFRKRKK